MTRDTGRLEVFFDGGCAVCAGQARRWRARDSKARRLQLVDITDAGFDPGPLGKTRRELMGQIHARRPDGRWLAGVEVLREITGQRHPWLATLSRLPGVAATLDAGYRLFARNRRRWFGPPTS